MKKLLTICAAVGITLSMSSAASALTKVAFSSTQSWWTWGADTATTTTPGPFYLFTHAQAKENVTPGNWVVSSFRAPATGFWQKILLGTTEPTEPENPGIGTNASATCFSKAVSAPLPLGIGWGLAKAWQSPGPKYNFFTDAGKSATSPRSEADGEGSAYDPVDFTWSAGTHTLNLEYGLKAGTSLRADPDTDYGEVFDVNSEDYTRRVSMTLNSQIDFLGDILGDQDLFSLVITHDGDEPTNDLFLGAGVTITESSLGSTEALIEEALGNMWSEGDYLFQLDSDFYIRLDYTFTLSEAETTSVSYSCESVAGVEIVPEPGTILLLGFGGLVLLRRRKV